MDKSFLKNLEDAAGIVMASPNMITSEQRSAAESIFVNFRKTKSPYVICQHILENSSVELVMFEAADVLKRAIIVEWRMLQQNDRVSLRQYLLNFVLHRDIPSSVREKLLQVIAIIIKRSSVDDFGVERVQILAETQKLIKSGDVNQQLISCSMIMAIMQEYVNTVKSDDTGLTFYEHFKAKKHFENSDLKKVFIMILEAMKELLKVYDNMNSMHLHLMKQFLNIMELILTWSFISVMIPKKIINICETVAKTNQAPPLRLSIIWENVILDPTLLDIFFYIYWKVRDNVTLQTKALTCLVQLSTLNGPVLNGNRGNNLAYLLKYSTHFIRLLTDTQLKDSEALGYSMIIRKLLLFHKASTELTALPADLFNSLLQQMHLLTVKFIEYSANEEIVCPEENIYVEALENMLEAWLLILQSKECYKGEVISYYMIQIFNKYLQSHLSPSDGTRGADRGELEITEIEEDDRDRFKEQLIIIGYFGREILSHVLPVLAILFEDKIQKLGVLLHRVHVQSLQITIGDAKIMQDLFEDLQWLLLISGHVLAMDSESESSLIPAEINEYSEQCVKNGTTDVGNSLRVLGSPNLSITDVLDGENNADLVIRIVTSTFRLCELEKDASRVGMEQFLSPSLSSTLMWFYKIWSESYLLPLPEYYSSLSPCLELAFGKDSAAGKWTVDYLLFKICLNLQKFGSEECVIRDTINLFLSILKRNHRCIVVFNSDVFKHVVELRDLNVAVSVKKSLMKGFILIASVIEDKSVKQEYLNQFLLPIVNRYKTITCDADFNRMYHGENIKAGIISILEEISGCVQGCQLFSTPILFNAFKPIFLELPNLCDLYHNYSMIIELILELLCDIISYIVNIVEEQHIRQTIYECCIAVIRVYVKHNANRISKMMDNDDDYAQDILLLLNIFKYLLLQSIMEDDSDFSFDSGDVCIQGLTLIGPIITMELFKLPEVCLQYFRTITLFVETKTHKLPSVSPEFIKQLLSSIEIGLTNYNSEIQSKCFDFLQEFGNGVYFNQDENASISIALKPFLKLLLDMIFSQQVDSQNKNECYSTLFVLICCYPTDFKELMKQFIQAQSHLRPEDLGHLMTQFDLLMSHIQYVNHRTMKNKFIDHFDEFLINICYIYRA